MDNSNFNFETGRERERESKGQRYSVKCNVRLISREFRANDWEESFHGKRKWIQDPWKVNLRAKLQSRKLADDKRFALATMMAR